MGPACVVGAAQAHLEPAPQPTLVTYGPSIRYWISSAAPTPGSSDRHLEPPPCPRHPPQPHGALQPLQWHSRALLRLAIIGSRHLTASSWRCLSGELPSAPAPKMRVPPQWLPPRSAPPHLNVIGSLEWPATAAARPGHTCLPYFLGGLSSQVRFGLAKYGP
jgi:hypothetical protein